jgi:hypothetical protein
VEVVRFRIEGSDGATLRVDEPIPTGMKFRFRFSSSRDGYLYLVAPDANGAYTTLLTNAPAAATRVRSNSVGKGRNVIFPGGAATLSVAEGETRFLAFVAQDRESVPEFLKATSLQRLDSRQVEQLEKILSLSSSAGTNVTSAAWTSVTSAADASGPVGFEVLVTGRRMRN